MEKTRSLTGKILMAILILFALSAPFMSSASALFNPATNSLPTTQVFLTPSRINGTTVGQVITVYANITNVNGLATVYLGLTWSNTTVAQCTGVGVGTIFSKELPSNEYLQGPGGSYDNVHGTMQPYTWGTTDSFSVNGSGSMINFNFTIAHVGYSDVHLIGIYLGNVPGATIPATTVDYFTTIRAGHQYIVKIQGNPTQSSSIPPDNAGFYKENVTQMSPSTEGGVTNLIGNLTFAINGTSYDFGPFGYFNVTIPNNLMNCSGNNDNWVIETNNGTGVVDQSTRTVSQGTTTTTISLAAANFYPSGTYGTTIVNIYSTSIAVPEFASMFSTILLATVLMLATLAAALFTIITPSRKRKD